MGSIGWPEITVLVLVAFLIFGPKRLPELARSVGDGIREFKKAMNASGENNSATAEVDAAKSDTPHEPPAVQEK
ncbi:MAG: Sec-independent protein translocase subunit TatA/TatB [Armatimonadota bacterium]